jgi:hypothetical protein
MSDDERVDDRDRGAGPGAVAAEHERVGDWDAAYVLGALASDERREFERHLSACGRCRAAVAELAGIPGLLALTPEPAAAGVAGPVGAGAAGAAGSIRPVPDATSPSADVVDLAAVAGTIRSRRRRRTGWLAVAAAGALVVGGGAGWAVSAGVHGGDGTAVSVAAGTSLDLAPVGGSGVSASLRFEPTGWGTRFAWSCSYPEAWGPSGGPADLPGAGTPVVYELVAVDDAGHETQVATWLAHGSGAKGLGASSSLAASTIRSVEIRVEGSPGALASATV